MKQNIFPADFIFRFAIQGGRMRIWGLLLLAAVVFFPITARGARDSQRILLLFSYHASYPLSHNLSSHIFASLQNAEKPYSVEIFELNSLQSPAPGAIRQRFEQKLPEIERGEYDIILAFSDTSMRTLLRDASRIPAETSIVFCNYLTYAPSVHEQFLRCTGTFIPPLLQKNIDLGRKLFPAAETAYLVTGTAAEGDVILEQWRKIGASGNNPIRMEALSGADLSTEELKEKLAGLKDAFVIFHNWTNTDSRNINAQGIIPREIIAASSVPVLALYDIMLRHGAVGGYMLRGEAIGRQVSDTLRQLVEGADIAEVEVQSETAFYVGHEKAFNRWKIDPARMPAGTVWLYQAPGFWKRNFYGLLIAAALAALLATIVIIFAVYRRSVRRNMEIFEALPVHIAIGNADGELIFRNSGSDSEAVKAVLRNEISQTLGDGKPRVCQYREGDAARTAYIALLTGRTFKARSAIAVSVDSSELQRAQDELRNSEERMRLTLMSIGDGVIVTDGNERIVMLNAVAAQMTGYAADEAGGMLLDDIFRIRSYHDDSVVPSPVAAALRESRVVELANHTDLISKDGRRYHIADSAAPILSASGECLGAILVFRDVTRENNERDAMCYKQTIMENSSELAHLGYFVFDPDKMVLENKLALPVSGLNFSGGDLLADLKQWSLPDDYQTFSAEWQRLISGETATVKIPLRAEKDHELRYYILFLQMLTTESHARKIVGLVQDLSDIKKFEEQYWDTVAMLHSFVQAFPTPAYIKDIGDGYRYVCANDAMAHLAQTELSQIIGKSDFELFADPLVARKLREADLLLQNDDETYTFSEKVVFREEERYFRSIKVIFKNSAGRRYLIGLSFDITDEENAKLEQNETRLLLQEIINNLPLTVTVKSPDQEFRYLYWNTAMTEHTGISSETAIGRNDSDIFPRSPQNEFFQRKDIEVQESGQVGFLLEALDARGEPRKYDSLKKLFQLPSGKKLILSLSRDVTVQKQLEANQQTMIEQLTRHVDYERLFNSCLHNVVRISDLAEAISGMLRQIGEASGADRCYIFQYSEDGGMVSNHYEWCAAGVLPVTMDLNQAPFIAGNPWYDTLHREELIRIDDVSTLSGEWSALRDLLTRQGIRSLLSSGIIADGRPWGFIGLEFVRETHTIAECDILMLRGAAHIFSVAWERNLQVEAIAKSVSLQRQTFESVAIPLVLFDLEHNIVAVNSCASVALGQPENELLGQKCHHVLCNHEEPPSWCPMQAALAERRPVEIHFEGHGDHHYLVTTQPIMDREGEPLYILESAVDITDLHAAMEAANAANRAKSTFLATMSHEIRTPLNAVIGFSELLQNDALPAEESKEYLRSINHAGTALLKLINDILELSKLEANQMKIVPERNDLRILCEEVRSIFAMQAKRKAIDFGMIYSRELPMLFLDLPRLRQILFNLVGNALKFTDEGKITVEVNFEKQTAETGELTLRIIDTGIGISPEFQTRLFNPFAQQENDIRGTRTQAGTGLGLSISKRLIEVMGGNLIYMPNPVGGSCFIIELHMVRYEDACAISEAEAPNSFQMPAEKRKILLVDDVPLNLKVLQAMLKPFPVELLAVSSGAEALEVLKAFHPDLILTDIWMPGMNGIQLAERIREFPELADVRIYAVTADSEAEQTFSVETFDGVLLKPVSGEKLRKMFEQINQL